MNYSANPIFEKFRFLFEYRNAKIHTAEDTEEARRTRRLNKTPIGVNYSSQAVFKHLHVEVDQKPYFTFC